MVFANPNTYIHRSRLNGDRLHSRWRRSLTLKRPARIADDDKPGHYLPARSALIPYANRIQMQTVDIFWPIDRNNNYLSYVTGL